MNKISIKFFLNQKLNKIRDLFKVKLYTIRSETKKKSEGEREVREREKKMIERETRTTNVVRNAGCARSRYTRNFFF